MERFPGLDPRWEISAARERIATLVREAENDRLIRAARHRDTASWRGLRTRLGRWFVRIGAAVAQEGDLLRTGEPVRMDQPYP